MISAIIGFIAVSFLRVPILFIVPSLFVFLGLVFLLLSLSIRIKFLKEIKPKIINYILETTNLFSQVEYSLSEKIELRKILSTGLIQSPDTYSGYDYITGKYKNVLFESSNVLFEEEVEEENEEGETTIEYEAYFDGRWYVFYFDKPLNGVLQITQSISYIGSGVSKIETESIVFNKLFNVYANNELMAFNIITPIMIEKILHLKKLTRGALYICFLDNQLHVGIDDSKKHLTLKFNEPINRDNLQYLIADFEFIVNIIDEFKLHTPKFMNRKKEK